MVLSFAGEPIEAPKNTPLADLGIGAEACIDVARPSPSFDELIDPPDSPSVGFAVTLRFSNAVTQCVVLPFDACVRDLERAAGCNVDDSDPADEITEPSAGQTSEYAVNQP